MNLIIAFALLGAVTSSPLHHLSKRSVIQYGDWSEWSTCSKSCYVDTNDLGTQVRYIDCINTDNNQIIPKCDSIIASCNLIPCSQVGAWEEWGMCSKSCDGGQRSRKNKMNTLSQLIPCNTQKCSSANGCGSADLIFVIDSSGSIGERNWFVVKQFAMDVISSLNVQPTETRVGVISFSTEVRTDVPIGLYTNSLKLQDDVWQMEYMAGSTNIAEGLQRMRSMLNLRGRPGAKDVVVLITDGESNIFKELTVPEANLAKNDGVTIFAIGVGDKINVKELEEISSKPLDKYMFTVTDFDALSAIVSTVSEGACNASNLIECDEWSEWSECSNSCGNGIQSRTRTCRILDDDGETVISIVEDKEDKVCENMPCTTTTPLDCSKCTFQANGVGYLQDPGNCNCYYLCQSDGSGGYIQNHQCCASGLFWSSTLLTCSWNKEVGCTVVANAESTTSGSTSTTASVACIYKSGQSNSAQFYYGNVLMGTCPDGLFWSEKACSCVGFANPECDTDILLYFPFDNTLNDISCNFAHTDVVGNVTLDNGYKGNAAYFDGVSHLEVPFLNNWFAGRLVNEWTVSLWVKRIGMFQQVSGLVNNGDCKESASFGVQLNAGNSALSGVTTTSATATITVATTLLKSNTWESVAFVYNGEKLVFYINGVKQDTEYLVSGPIANRQCAMNIGHMGKEANAGFFNGYIDELRIYHKALTAEQIQQLQ